MSLRNDWKIFRQGAGAWGLRSALIEQGHYFRARLHERIDRFDARFGTETSGMVGIGDLDGVGDNGADAVHYWPTRPVDFDRVMAELGEIDHRGHVFVDVGCGKGRVALLAAGLPFKRVVGFDFSPALVERARENLERYRGPLLTDVELRVCDAAEFDFPVDDLIVYMFDPFGPVVLTSMIAKLAASARGNGQRITMIYYSPDYEDIITGGGFELVRQGKGHSFPWQLYRIGF
ncbi:class I SAM-dependent methyltransferase [Actinokineospora sp. G85]|uniref:class I SAM-dependent methyltransferase n=1 Tax=Actinokineospora sp. G85 TaxID=3406626 RepID=UPI003C74CE4F